MIRYERPIIFSAPMVRAIIEGRKTQTRRVVKPQPDSVLDGSPFANGHGYGGKGTRDRIIKCPYGAPGCRLWVREACYIAPPNFAPPDGFHRPIDNEGRPRVVGYAASMDGDSVRCATEYGVSKTPSIHMPRWASRLTLEVVGVRVERLQEISDADCLAEGIDPHQAVKDGVTRPYREAYARLLDSIHGVGAWVANPWVWVVEFKKDGGS